MHFIRKTDTSIETKCQNSKKSSLNLSCTYFPNLNTFFSALSLSPPNPPAPPLSFALSLSHTLFLSPSPSPSPFPFLSLSLSLSLCLSLFPPLSLFPLLSLSLSLPRSLSLCLSVFPPPFSLSQCDGGARILRLVAGMSRHIDVIVSLTGLFCKRDLQFYVSPHVTRRNGAWHVTHMNMSLTHDMRV